MMEYFVTTKHLIVFLHAFIVKITDKKQREVLTYKDDRLEATSVRCPS